MAFDAEAFISYAHLDNAEPVEGHRGWIDDLHKALEVRLKQLTGWDDLDIWRDPELQGNDVFADTIILQLSRVAVFLAVVSPRYVQSEWARKELAEFWAAAERQGALHVEQKARIFKIMKTPVPLQKQPAELRALLGYEFFRIDPGSGKVRELNDVYGAEEQHAFLRILDDLAQDISVLLQALDGVPLDPAGRDQGAVFLAPATGDLKEQREAIRRDLLQHGVTVLPSGTLPLDCSDLESAVRADLARCRISIHLVGRNYAAVPEGASASLTEIQNELAIERGREDAAFARLLWIPPDVQVSDARQQHVIEQLRMDHRVQNGDLLETSFEDLRTAIHATLARRPTAPSDKAPAASGAKRVYAMYDQRDAEAVGPWVDFLFDQGVDVIRPVFEGSEAELREDHEESLRRCDAAVIFVGIGGSLWLRRKLGDVQKSAGYGRTGPAPVTAICPIPPKTAEKEGLRSHNEIVVPQFEGLAPEAWRPFLSRVAAAAER